MTYKEHLIFVAIRRDGGGFLWLPLAPVHCHKHINIFSTIV
jgi:hypothetical protein